MLSNLGDYFIMKSPLVRFAEGQVAMLQKQLAAAEIFLEEISLAESLTKELKERETDQWIYLPALSVRTGLTEDAIRSRIARGVFVEGVHWRRERPGQRTRQIFNVQAIQECLAGKSTITIPAFNSTMTSSGFGSSTKVSDALKR